MNIQELKEAKRKLETDLREAINDLYTAFKEDTGVSPNAIYVSTYAVDQIGGQSEWIIGDVQVDIEI
jgi:hypothetical protein